MKKASKQLGLGIECYVQNAKKKQKGNGVIIIDTTEV